MKNALGAFALAALLTACGGNTDEPDRSTAERAVSADQAETDLADLRSFANSFDGYSADYTPRTPDELAGESELVVVGEVTGLRAGRIFYAETMENAEAAQALTLAVKVEQVVKGSSAAAGDTVYVELPSGDRSVAEFQKALPSGARTVLYLTAAPVEEGNFRVGSEDQGRPPGASLWIPYTPQGFVLVADQGAVQPLDSATLEGVDISELLPS
jgi:hypothetical protein